MLHTLGHVVDLVPLLIGQVRLEYLMLHLGHVAFQVDFHFLNVVGHHKGNDGLKVCLQWHSLLEYLDFG